MGLNEWKQYDPLAGTPWSGVPDHGHVYVAPPEYTLQGTTITARMITARELQLAVPRATTAAQWQQIERVIQYGRSQTRPVTVIVTVID